MIIEKAVIDYGDELIVFVSDNEMHITQDRAKIVIGPDELNELVSLARLLNWEFTNGG